MTTETTVMGSWAPIPDNSRAMRLCSPNTRHDPVEPRYRKNQPNQREHSRQGALYDGETARHLGTLSHGTHIENRQPCIDFMDGVLHRWRQVDRISLGLHLHHRLVPRLEKAHIHHRLRWLIH